MKYFTMRELTQSATALRKGIDNTPSGTIKANLTALVANVLDPLREAYGQPIIVTSGYRCAALNRAVGGAKRSGHLYGYAADVRTVSDDEKANFELLKLIVKLGLPFNELIYEYGSNKGPDWVHVSYIQGKNQRKMLRAYRVKENGKTITQYVPFKL